MIPKCAFLCNYASTYEPSVIALTETWLRKDIPSGFLNLQHYVHYRKDRNFGRGGGSLLLVRDDIPSRPVLLSNQDLKIDAVACEISLMDKSTLGCLCIYRPPNSDKEEDCKMLSIITDFLNLGFNCNLIIGDFNFPDINWSHSSSCSQQSENFLRFTLENFLIQHVITPTRKSSQSLIDLVLTTPGTDVSNLCVSEELDNSDHYSITLSLKIKPDKIVRKLKRRTIYKANWSRFRQLLSSSDWQPFFSSHDVNVVWNSLLSNVQSSLDVVAPYKMVTLRNFVSTPHVRTALRRKRRSFHSLCQRQTLTNIISYEKSVAEVSEAIKADTLKRENVILRSKNSNLFWSYVNRRLSDNQQIISISVDDEDVVDEKSIANTFNEYFSSVFSPKMGPVAPTASTNEVSLDITSVSVDDVIKILKRLPPKTSTDEDGLSYKIFKEGGLVLATCLSHLFTVSLCSGRIPSTWKVAIVKPLHKKGPKNEIKNYRPISITSCCCRILERVVRVKIDSYLRENSVISCTQHGFQSGRSTESLLLQFYDFVTSELDSNMIVETIFFDFAKAFDRIPHCKLIDCLDRIGISGSLLKWFSDFFSDRFQKVRINSTTSEPCSVTSGIVQGSVLGPTLFNIYINSIDDAFSNCHILKYADDVRIFLSAKKQSDALHHLRLKVQHDIDSIFSWADACGMSLNINKCFQVSFGQLPVDASFSYTLNNEMIPCIDKSSFNDLGLTVSSPFSFNNHVSKITKKAFQRLGLINKVFENRTETSLLHLYKSFVRPIVEYSSVVWNPYTSCNINKLERIQKRMTRMPQRIRHLPYRDRLKSLNLLSLQSRRLRAQVILIFKMFQCEPLQDLNNYFTFSSSTKTRGHRYKINTKSAKSNYRLRFFTVSAIVTWNSLPEKAVNAPSLSVFKRELSSFFQSKGFW